MPTITFTLNDLQRLVGKKITPKELETLAHYAKGELESYDTQTDEAAISLDDTNLPYLWSVEGMARLFRGVLGRQKGLPRLDIIPPTQHITVDASVKNIRPFIAAFRFTGPKLSEYALKQLIQLQEKFCDGYGRKRQKVSIGLYTVKRITFPVRYTTTLPDAHAFVPLDFTKKLTPRKILEQHPKGKDYGWILKDAQRYPILLDAHGEVLSLPPIINANVTGKIEVGDTDILFEATGSDEESVNLAAAIFAQALAEREYAIHALRIQYGAREKITPEAVHEEIMLKAEDISSVLGSTLSETKVKDLLERAGYAFSNDTVTIPHYRADIMHKIDVIEDIAIMYGFENITAAPLANYTVGGTTAMVQFADNLRELMLGLGYQEIMSQILSSKDVLYRSMNTKDMGTVEIKEYMSETYSVIRSWLLPILMEALAKNKHAEYPQRVFEQGLTTTRTATSITDHEKLAAVTAHRTANFSEAKQAVDAVFSALGLDYTLQQYEHTAFIPGRCGSIRVRGKSVGIIGELHPAALSAHRLEVPVAGFEIDMDALQACVKK